MKVGVIGLGHGSRVLIKAFNLANFEIYGVSSKTNKKTVELNENYKIYNNWIDLIKDRKIKIIAIAVPPYLQPKILNECIKYKKIIFAEKPISANFISSKRILHKLLKYNNHFIVDYIFPEHNLFLKFKKLISKKKNNRAKIKVCFSNKSYVLVNNIINWKTRDKDGGGLINLYMPHIIDYIIFLFGDIKKVLRVDNGKNRFYFEAIFILNNNIEITTKINSNSRYQNHEIEYENQFSKIKLVNKSKDYVKHFKLIDFSKTKKDKKIYFDQRIKTFEDDSRILLSSKIIKKLKNDFNKKEHINLINRYLNVEKWINQIKNKI